MTLIYLNKEYGETVHIKEQWEGNMENNKNNTPQNKDFAAATGEQNEQSINTKSTSVNPGNPKSSPAKRLKIPLMMFWQKLRNYRKSLRVGKLKRRLKIEQQKTNLVQADFRHCSSIRQVGKIYMMATDEIPLPIDRKYGETIARTIEKVSGYFDEKELGEIVRDVEHFDRKQPAIFIGAAFFAAGLLAARFLKSGSGK